FHLHRHLKCFLGRRGRRASRQPQAASPYAICGPKSTAVQHSPWGALGCRSVGGEARAGRPGVEALKLLLQAVSLAAPGRGFARLGPRSLPPFALTEPGREPADQQSESKGAEQEQEQRGLDGQA